MTKAEDKAARILGAKGGKERARRLTPQQRSESARKAARVRWDARGALQRVRHAIDTVKSGDIDLEQARMIGRILRYQVEVAALPVRAECRGIMRGLFNLNVDHQRPKRISGSGKGIQCGIQGETRRPLVKRQREQTGNLWKCRGWWYLRYRENEVEPDGTIKRVQKAERLAPVEGETRSKHSRLLLALMEERMAIINGSHSSTTPLALMNVAEFVEQVYLPDCKKNLRPTTCTTLESIWRSQIKARVGHIKLRDFRTSMADAMLQAIADEGKVHRSYIRTVKTELSAIFRLARRKDAITIANPVRDAALPRSAKKLEKRGTYVLTDILRMLAALQGTAKVAVATAAFAGLRRGELAGLEWADYDGKQLFIRHNISGYVEGEVKTESSEAAVPVIPYLRGLLEQYQPQATSRRFIFSDQRGDWLRLGHFAAYHLVPVLSTLGIPWHGWHGFRRGLATNLHDLGVDDQTIQSILRHSNVRITQDSYIRSLPKQAVEGMAKLEAALANCEAVVKQTIQ